MNRRTAVLALVVSALLSAAACTNSTTGSGTPAPTTNTSQPGSSSPAGGSALASVQPCSLLSASDLSQNQLGSPIQENLGGARTCRWQNTIANNGDGYTIGVGIREHQGINGAGTDTDKVTTDNIGSHPGSQLQSTISGSCIIAIGVTSTSRVDVTVNAGTDPVQGCQLANLFAKLVEPNLPPASN